MAIPIITIAIMAIMSIPIITIAIMAIAVSQPIAWVGAWVPGGHKCCRVSKIYCGCTTDCYQLPIT